MIGNSHPWWIMEKGDGWNQGCVLFGGLSYILCSCFRSFRMFPSSLQSSPGLRSRVVRRWGWNLRGPLWWGFQGCRNISSPLPNYSNIFGGDVKWEKWCHHCHHDWLSCFCCYWTWWAANRTDASKWKCFVSTWSLKSSDSFFFTPTWGRFPFGLIFFKWVETTN